MKKQKLDLDRPFPFARARRVTPEEVEAGRQAIETLTGKKRRRRPGPRPKPATEKYQPIAIRLHPSVVAWAKKEGHKRGVGYQTVINETLMKLAS